MAEKSTKTLEDPPQNPRADFTALLHFVSEEQLSGKAPLGFTKLSRAIDEVSYSLVLNCRQPSYSRELEANGKYKHVTPSLQPLVTSN